MDIRVYHTADLPPATLAGIRALLDAAFDGDFDDEDWDHALGGMHATAWHDGTLVGHASVVRRQFRLDERPLRVGYIEAVAVRADHRRRGVGGALMAPLERIIRDAYDLGALSSSHLAVPFYEGRGWQRLRGPSWAMTPDGLVRTEDDDDGIFVLADAPVNSEAGLACDWRAGDVW
ncbi:GNAT family N-acetyltransferase [Actinophytocola oryzae]|uniref:Aminoglycoside 2'-N-acetyltransferase I n=1 Tax=Actinophytocola oryzae TaxID=502181 RepID=A0A4R7W571_9PSEU|nr:GNAT family N-acetyltransferase [Actinophytocola oryzae]TDV57238.1 aminoglycoside 2'-N-acetyltransferase I [Actinophytocola oryzae]